MTNRAAVLHALARAWKAPGSLSCCGEGSGTGRYYVTASPVVGINGLLGLRSNNSQGLPFFPWFLV